MLDKTNTNTSTRNVLTQTSPTKLNIQACDWKRTSLSNSNSTLNGKIMKNGKPSLIRTQSLTNYISMNKNSIPNYKSYSNHQQTYVPSSPIKQNIHSSNNTKLDNSKILLTRPKISLPAPPLLRRNSSFFKDELPSHSFLSSNSSNNIPTITTKPSLSYSSSHITTNTTIKPIDSNSSAAPTSTASLMQTVSTSNKDEPSQDNNEDSNNNANNNENKKIIDRFFPTIQNRDQNKIDPQTLEDKLPSPNASPTAHLRAQTKLVFKQTVAEACGLSMNQRVLQYMKEPPLKLNSNNNSSQTYNLKKRTHYNYNTYNQNQLKFTQDLLKIRKINSTPERILDAPGFQDDFYLNLLSWSSKNILAIALETALYLWDGNTGDVSMLVDFNNILITSIVWSDDDCHISIGKNDGTLEIWDIDSMSLVRTMKSHLNVRIGSQSWLETLIATGSKSGEIQINDVRIKNHIVSTWDNHKGEVCGLSYKSDGLQLASGGNDNTVMIWDTRTSLPQFIKRNHNAAVKALSWCPYIPNLLATGGGQYDKSINFWNTTNGARVGTIQTGSQVSSLHWGQSYSKTLNSANSSSSFNKEIIATGGSPSNSISIFNYDTKFKVAEIENAHDSRINCSQLSPDGTTLATVGGDENLKFFRVFDSKKRFKKRSKGIISDEMLSLINNHNSSFKLRRPRGGANLDENYNYDYQNDDDDSETDDNIIDENSNNRTANNINEYIIR
ncbi:hypothetical protein TBLA_0A01540 [Henningerozyma blattae CBS 6284]|uniref:CDC20/Fizzy WD40 domain-containing protein n=1 Tax=Henningerozyma blattae (strain ATCC 34711 / CBS 6284 / DSM 70876 / NBRC 10599 / NRRL Y-10934 / UCD 77-7) TaxID=1071380 RepID=I2GV01_HENB6|nr:hypothetical protein TBLA_0A01540 [Tetrapisispora blattae CBS 6284]CCH57953.1 hypothetical protein TBLA_0A01540 [Tetrapisispora blattae CBS 6284]